jgi:hypothetical protein
VITDSLKPKTLGKILGGEVAPVIAKSKITTKP